MRRSGSFIAFCVVLFASALLGFTQGQNFNNGGTAGGSNGQIQYNSNGAFAGATGFTYSSSTSPTVSLTSQTSAGVTLALTGGATGSGTVLTLTNGSGSNRYINIGASAFFDNGANLNLGGASLQSAGTIGTNSNCSSSASPAVCGSSASGSVTVAAAATTEVVDTTAVTANSQVQLTFDSSLGTKLGVTCNTTPVQPTVSARTGGTSFTITLGTAPTTNPACFSYTIVN